MAGDRKSIIALAAMLLVLPILPVYASESEWKTAYGVGRFLYSDPPRPDQVFKIHARAINGAVEELHAGESWFSANVTSAHDGILEIRYPRNYPYTNEFINEPGVQPLLFVNGMETLPEATPAEVTDCFFVFSIPFSESAEIGLAWPYLAVAEPHYGDDVPDSCTPETIVNVPTRKDGTISPLQQFKAGVKAEDVLCGDGYLNNEYRLVVHPDGKPFCVTRSSATELIQRWGVTIPA
ncbi:hypothetical protein [Nitrososphaera sp.]|uniref:hypothetical protein n=1 Tax=Nitrososphaera sp. TaxID=1971748 RepID=UPI00185AE805|nr:hypothetical protein [Nitrososphaera sp.]NWG37492.1 hypothetical protein [Nitrososphaera sp.]